MASLSRTWYVIFDLLFAPGVSEFDCPTNLHGRRLHILLSGATPSPFLQERLGEEVGLMMATIHVHLLPGTF